MLLAFGTKNNYCRKVIVMIKVKMLLLVFQIERMLKRMVPRESKYQEVKKILDSITNKIAGAKTEIL